MIHYLLENELRNIVPQIAEDLAEDVDDKYIDNIIDILDQEGYEKTPEIQQEEFFPGYPISVSYSPDGKSLAIGLNDEYEDYIYIWNHEEEDSGEELCDDMGRHVINSVCYSPDGKHIASGTDHGTILFDLKTMKSKNLQDTGYETFSASVCFSPDGKLLASGENVGENHPSIKDNDKPFISIWDVNTGNIHMTLNEEPYSLITNVCFSPDGKNLAVANKNKIQIWDLARKEGSKVIQAIYTDSLCFSPDGRFLAFSHEKSIKIWNLNDETIDTLWKGRYVFDMSVCYSPNGRYLASYRYGKITIWKNGEAIRIFRHEGVTSISFSPDGRYLVSGGGSWVRTWNLKKLSVKSDM